MDDNEFCGLRLEEKALLVEESLLLIGPGAYYQRYLMPYYRKIGLFISKNVKNQQDAQDIQQEVFMKAFQAIRNYYILEDRERLLRPLPWLQKIAHNLMCDYWKHIIPAIYTTEIAEIMLQLKDSETLPEEAVERGECYEQLAEAFARLSKQGQDIIKKRYFLSYSYQDIAKQGNCSEEAARQRCSRAIKQLRNILLKIRNAEV